ncbi:sigma-E processing peptidase SpoIIGA [Alkaliphilus sp. B6464]|uniref:sigma-E processing peptidase SpoIIGA n=1 Tax=Alkaliphilus sp. B6464 TaxID=2731219 RepID=UPI001BAB9B5A|nr:sigma-E processing peptidase SpoIIGA [Alkaliphilus sp. B6464]QUH20943.1 sigma-E processing peptidase SpoIIGA [Alkaliphilus sp. B6464]
MIVYAEYVFLENFIMNYIILSLTGKFAKYPTKRTKLILASSLGALYAFIIFFPSLYFLFSILMKIACSMLIIILSFTPYRFKDFFRLMGIFYLITLVFGGAGFALFYFTSFNGIVSNGIFYMTNISIKNIFISCGIGYILIQFCWGYIQKQLSKEKILMNVRIKINDEIVDLKGIVDTGNSLTDPISKYPVIIVEYNAIKSLLPVELKDVFLNNHAFNFEQVVEQLVDSNWITRFRIIPYQALGTENGMLVGFKPDNVLIHDDKHNRDIKEIIVAIYHKKLSKTGDYMALLHPDII